MSDASLNEELISALMDGELSGSELDRAEKLLAENPHLQQQLDFWRDQASEIRALPKYQLDNEFADRVLQSVQEAAPVAKPSDHSHASDRKKSKSKKTELQVGITVLATLAAGLLVALFVYPNLNNDSLAHLEPDSVAADELSESSIAGKIVANNEDEMLLRSKSSSKGEFDKEISNQFDDFSEFEELADKSAPTKSMAQNESGTSGQFGPDHIMRRGGQDYVQQGQGIGVGLAGKGSGNKPTETLSNPGSALTGDKKPDTPPLAASGNRVDQVLWIDMQHHPQPLNELEGVFNRNEIQVLNSEGQNVSQNVDTDKSIQSKPGSQLVDNSLSNQSQSGIEALYVVSTSDQMKQAMLELSSQANISGYNVPSVPQYRYRQQIAGQQNSSVQSAAPNQPARELNNWQNSKATDVPTDGKRFDDIEKEKQQSQVSAAQQLQPFEFSNQNKEEREEHFSKKSNQATESENEEIEKLANWFKLSERSPQPRLNQYLLLIQTSATESASSARQNARMLEAEVDASKTPEK